MIFDPVKRWAPSGQCGTLHAPGERHSLTGHPVYCHHERTIKY